MLLTVVAKWRHTDTLIYDEAWHDKAINIFYTSLEIVWQFPLSQILIYKNVWLTEDYN